MTTAPASRGRLLLVPNALDLGNAPADLRDVLPLGVLQTAARLTHWVAENAKSTRAFLKRVDALVPLAQPLQALEIRELPRPVKGATHGPTKGPAAKAELVARDAAWAALLAPAMAGHDLGLISEAGLPAVADPGAALVAAAHAAGLVVQPLAGPSALLLALAASGLNGQRFAFAGYVPQEATAQHRAVQALEQRSRQGDETQLLIETPYRNAALLRGLLSTLASSTQLSVSVGLTLASSWTHTAPVAAWRQAPRELPGDTPAVFAFLAR
jgi:16S rRNA (cytidine1402-2'-O)-methyltransferase